MSEHEFKVGDRVTYSGQKLARIAVHDQNRTGTVVRVVEEVIDASAGSCWALALPSMRPSSVSQQRRAAIYHVRWDDWGDEMYAMYAYNELNPAPEKHLVETLNE